MYIPQVVYSIGQRLERGIYNILDPKEAIPVYVSGIKYTKEGIASQGVLPFTKTLYKREKFTAWIDPTDQHAYIEDMILDGIQFAESGYLEVIAVSEQGASLESIAAAILHFEFTLNNSSHADPRLLESIRQAYPDLTVTSPR